MPRPLRLALPALFLLAGCAPQRDPQIAEMAARVSPDRIRRTVETLVAFGTRNSMSAVDSPNRGIGAARRWIQSEFESISRANNNRLRVELDSYTQQPDNNRITRPTEITNVVATLPGTQPASAGRLYVVTGHYDSMCTDPKDFNCDAPGADDDASGVAVVLELARVMSAAEFDATLVFITVAGEEQGLLGSKHWAAQAKQKNLDVAGMISNDIVGASVGPSGVGHGHHVRVFSEGVPVSETPAQAKLRLATGSENDSPSRQFARYADESVAAYLSGFEVALIFRRDRYLRGSDHMSFAEQGYPALRFTEYEENFDHQHQNVRKEGGRQFGDLPRYCDWNYIAGVARANLVTLASAALAPAAPKRLRIITAKLTNDTTLCWDANAEPDLFGYEVLWRDTTAPRWQAHRFVGNVNQITVPLSKDNVQFGVRAIDSAGHLSPVAAPLPAKE